MEKVYLLKSGMHSDISVEGVFSTKEKAEAALAELKKIHSEKAGPIVAVTLDELCQHTAKAFWFSTISVMTGELQMDMRFDRGIRYHWSHNCAWLQADTIRVDQYPYSTGYIPGNLNVYSSQSQEHADKLAVESHQYLMKNIDFSLIQEKHGGLFYPVKEQTSSKTAVIPVESIFR